MHSQIIDVLFVGWPLRASNTRQRFVWLLLAVRHLALGCLACRSFLYTGISTLCVLDGIACLIVPLFRPGDLHSERDSVISTSPQPPS